MTDEEAWAVISVLVNETTGWNDDAAEMYHAEMLLWPDADAAMAAVRTVGRNWIERSRPPFAIVAETYRDELRDRSAQHGRPAQDRPLCDGTSWLDNGEPCPRCNPYLAIIFADPARKRRWRDGTAIKHLVDIDGLPLPANCLITSMVDPEDPLVSPTVGRMIAWSAYVADCNTRGVESMPRETFMKRLGTVKPQPERTP